MKKQRYEVLRMSVILPFLLFGFLLISCDALVSDAATCPSVYTITTVQVLTADGQPVVLDEWTVYDKRSGKELDLCDSDDCIAGNSETGTYLLIDDRFQGKVGVEINLTAEGAADSIHFKEDFTVRDNGCNLVKISGPGTIYTDL